MPRIKAACAVGGLVCCLSLIGCPPPDDDDDSPGGGSTQSQRPIGSVCGAVVVACLDELARQPVNLICFRPQARWERTSLTWRLVAPLPGLSPADQTGAVRQALDQWEAASSLTFTQTDGDADLSIAFDAGDPFPFDGPGRNLGYAFFPGTMRAGEVHLCEQEAWAVAPAAGRFDLATVVLHEIGHALGLEHSLDENDVMAPNYDEAGRRVLTAADIAAVQRLYGAPGAPVPAIPEMGEGFCAAVGSLTALGDPDSDGDGIPDTIEAFALDTDAFVADSDGDGADDLFEVFNANAAVRSDPLDRDSDDDGTADGADPAPEDPAITTSSATGNVFSVQLFVDGTEAARFELNDNVSGIGVGTVNADPTAEFAITMAQTNSDTTLRHSAIIAFRTRGAVPGQPIDAARISGVVSMASAIGTQDTPLGPTPLIEQVFFCNCDCPSFGGTDCGGIGQLDPPTGTIDLTLAGGRLSGSFDFTADGPLGHTLRLVGEVNLPELFGASGSLDLVGF